MEIRKHDCTTNNQTQDNIERSVFNIDPAGTRTWDLLDSDTMKTGV